MKVVIPVVLLLAGLASEAPAVSILGGGSKRNDCVVTMQAPGLGFPAGKTFKGATCADGSACDGDGVLNGACEFPVSLCLNVEGEGIPACGAATVQSITLKGKMKGGTLDLSALQAAVDGLALPTGDPVCTAIAPVVVAVRGPDNKGELSSGQALVKSKAKTSRGTDKDKFKLVCLPSTTGETPSTTSTTSTTEPGATTTTSTLPVGMPGAGMQVEIQDAQVDASGVVTATFLLTDDAGVAITPTGSSTSDPNMARVRLAIARLEVDEETAEGFTTTFTKWRNYVVNASSQPGYDSGGTFAVGAAPGLWTYTFKVMLPAGFGQLTHRVAGQVQRTYQGESLIGNPIFDFVPAGGPVTVERDVVTTAECNQCHNPLALHGGGRREVKLCQVCHTDQYFDPTTGATIDFKNMIHRIHRGKDLPSVTDGAVGDFYGIVGFNNNVAKFGEKVSACVGGALAGLPCESDADCPSGTCTGATTVGVGFPKDLRNCTTCHSQGAEADNYKELPNTLACTGCHDDVNPGQTTTDAGPPGTGHLPGDQPEAFCRICHTSEGDEFDISVPGAHVVPARSQELTGIVATIQSVTGTPGNPVSIAFSVVDNDGAAVDVAGFNRVAFAMSGPTTDLGGSSAPLVQQTMVGGGSGGVLTGPDGSGNYTYTSTVVLPADAEGSWRLGLEMRRPVTLSDGETTVNEAAQNPVLDFSVDGSPVEPRREVVDIQNCGACHGTFSVDFSIHGNLRNQTEYCVICHNPNVTDFARRVNAVGVGANPMNEAITFKHLIHHIHRGEELAHHPFIVYGFGSAPANFTAHDFSEVRFPGDLRDCAKCHVDDSYELPLPEGLLPTRQSIVDNGVETVVGAIPPIQDACLACHDEDDAMAHAETMTTGSGAEACNVCHEEGALIPVSEAHAR